ncbi:hypothetical protein K443DRAFT_118645 [Laccaria amethystina LaAM-08-1]|uniref:Uncharacterized protein n=1 Tax=Laccaria amethystina LaAM-08-1 TaxID=1095629 RepID=A0A0C9Y5G1_9AGAR|nr:hypothetical protein K443DRAFT_118645 [Laccaria amethystina LaAM-08-1]
MEGVKPGRASQAAACGQGKVGDRKVLRHTATVPASQSRAIGGASELSEGGKLAYWYGGCRARGRGRGRRCWKDDAGGDQSKKLSSKRLYLSTIEPKKCLILSEGDKIFGEELQLISSTKDCSCKLFAYYNIGRHRHQAKQGTITGGVAIAKTSTWGFPFSKMEDKKRLAGGCFVRFDECFYIVE